MQGRTGAIALLIPALLVLGCSHWRSGGHLDYRTIRADPHHDSEKAHAENHRAIELLDKGKIDKAEQALQKALIADVTYGPAHNNLGKLYFCQGKYYLAAWEFEYATKLMPQRPECQNNLGMVYEAVGKLDDAVNSYTLAYGIDDKNPVIIGNLARARIRRGDEDPVIQQLLADLRLYDTRAEWLRWANDRLALGPAAAGPPSLPMTKGSEEDDAWRDPKLLDTGPEIVSPPLEPDVEQELPLLGVE